MSKPLQWLAADQYIPGIDIFAQNQPTKQMTTGGTPEFMTLNAMRKEAALLDGFAQRLERETGDAGGHVCLPMRVAAWTCSTGRAC